MIKNVELVGEPLFPVAFLIHDCRKGDDHQQFLNFVFKRLKMNSNIPIVTDRERAITNVFLGRAETKDNHFCCTNHILTDAKLKANSLMVTKEANIHIDDVRTLVKADNLQEYLD